MAFFFSTSPCILTVVEHGRCPLCLPAQLPVLDCWAPSPPHFWKVEWTKESPLHTTLRPLCPDALTRPSRVLFGKTWSRCIAILYLVKWTDPSDPQLCSKCDWENLVWESEDAALEAESSTFLVKGYLASKEAELSQASSMQSVEPAKPVCTFQAVLRQHSGSVLRTVLLFRVHPSHTLPGLAPSACFSNYHRSLPQLLEKGCDCLLSPLLPPRTAHQDSQSRLQSSASPPWLYSGTTPWSLKCFQDDPKSCDPVRRALVWDLIDALRLLNWGFNSIPSMLLKFSGYCFCRAKNWKYLQSAYISAATMVAQWEPLSMARWNTACPQWCLWTLFL